MPDVKNIPFFGSKILSQRKLKREQYRVKDLESQDEFREENKGVTLEINVIKSN